MDEGRANWADNIWHYSWAKEDPVNDYIPRMGTSRLSIKGVRVLLQLST